MFHFDKEEERKDNVINNITSLFNKSIKGNIYCYAKTGISKSKFMMIDIDCYEGLCDDTFDSTITIYDIDKNVKFTREINNTMSIKSFFWDFNVIFDQVE
ncbi:MAG: hypothetical protein AABY22_26660 [Nanoarchaeota archaeon]